MWEHFTEFWDLHGASILTAVIIVAVGLLLSKIVMRIVRRALQKSTLDKTGYKFILTLLRIVLVAVVIMIALSQLGVDMTSMVAVLSVVGLALSLAVQDCLANVASGFILLFTKPFHVGDFIDADGLTGTVSAINLVHTELVTYDNKVITIPNGQMSSAKLTNYSRLENRMIDLALSIPYDQDIDPVRELLLQVFRADERILPDPAPVVYVREFAASSVDLSARVWVKTSEYSSVLFATREAVKKAFDENGIAIPFPQLDVHLDR